jgi:hypothetical protein
VSDTERADPIVSVYGLTEIRIILLQAPTAIFSSADELSVAFFKELCIIAALAVHVAAA